MRKPWVVLLPILIFAQSSTPPREPAPIDNAVTGAKGAKNGPTKTNQATAQSLPDTQSSDTGQNSTKTSPPDKTAQIAPDPIVRYTFWLVIVGVLQFLALIVQAIFLYKAFTETTKATRLTTRAVKEAERSNAANEVLTKESSAAAKTATELTRQSLILSHRPKLIVRNVVVPQFQELPKTFVVFSNYWPSEPITPFVEKEAEPVIPLLRPGVYGTKSFECPRDFDSPVFNELFSGRPALFIQGYIGYRDDIGNFRSTSFCRMWSQAQRRFIPPENNEDLENSD